MSPRYLMFGAFVMLGGYMLSHFMQGTFFDVTDLAIMNDLAVFRTHEVFGTWSVPMLNLRFFTHGLTHLIAWDYGFFGGGYAIFQYLLYVISIGIVWGIATTFIFMARLWSR